MKDPGASQAGSLFDLRDYARLLRTFLDRGYETVSYSEARSRLRNRKDRFVIWRHDIDFCLRKAEEVARLESRLGVRADYFVLVRSLMYNPHDLRETSRLEEILNPAPLAAVPADSDIESACTLTRASLTALTNTLWKTKSNRNARFSKGASKPPFPW